MRWYAVEFDYFASVRIAMELSVHVCRGLAWRRGRSWDRVCKCRGGREREQEDMQIWQTWQIWQIWQIRQSGIGGPSERRDPRRCCVTVRSRYKKGIILRDIVGIVRMCVSNGMYAVRRVGGWRGLGLILIRQSQTGINVLYEVLYCTIRDG